MKNYLVGHLIFVEKPKAVFALRLYGEDARAVAKAKGDFGKILAGDVAMDGASRIWDEFFY